MSAVVPKRLRQSVSNALSISGHQILDGYDTWPGDVVQDLDHGGADWIEVWSYVFLAEARIKALLPAFEDWTPAHGLALVEAAELVAAHGEIPCVARAARCSMNRDRGDIPG